MMNVTRYNVLEGAERCFRKTTFNPKTALSVRFVGERGVDTGDLSRELMTLLLKSIKDCEIFRGEENKKYLSLNVGAASLGKYKLYGTMIAYMLCHDGPAPKFFSKNLFLMLVEGVDLYSPQLDDADPSLKSSITKICNASNDGEFHEAVSGEVENVAIYIGAGNLLSLQKKNELVDTLVNHSVKTNLRTAYTEFENGLSTLGVLDAIRAHPHEMEQLFVYDNQALKLEDMVFDVQYSSEGSNRYIEEINTHAMWLDYLEEIAEKGELGVVLAFITGMQDIPPLGFHPPLTLAFIHPQEADELDKGVPYANTCSNTLHLPVAVSYTKLSEVMNTVLFEIGCIFVNE